MKENPDKNTIAIKFDVLCAQVEGHCQCDGLSQADILIMPVPLATLLNHLVRQDGLTVPEIATAFSLTEAESAQVIGMLLQKGLVTAEWNTAPGLPMHKYKAHMAPKRQRKAQTAIWKALDL